MQARLSQNNLDEFLRLVGAASLADYLAPHGPTPTQALEARLAWADQQDRASAEARFLRDHAQDLRAVVTQGPSWQTRAADDERRARADEVHRRPVLTAPPTPRRATPTRIDEDRTFAPDPGDADDSGYLTLMEFLTAPPPPTRHDVALKLGERETPIRPPRLEARPSVEAFTTPDGRTIEPPPRRPEPDRPPPRSSTTMPLLAGVLGATALVLAWLVLR